MQRTIARMNARIFVGEPLYREEEWLHVSIDFSTCVFIGAGYLKIFPPCLGPLAAIFNPYIRRIHQHHQTGRRLMDPILSKRRELAVHPAVEPYQKPQDMFQWLLDDPLEANATVDRLVALQLVACFGATDSTTNHITNVLFDLAARWDEYASELRAEIEEVLRADGDIIRKAFLNKLSKLDSFMKESQRLNPLGA
ncbi:hypothetical protein MMC30_005743, partial [Trapelia coarctata]|nr:hypothetical protein [Trapelia coarctata]